MTFLNVLKRINRYRFYLYRKYDWYYFKSAPISWIYSAYLTIRYIDEWSIFPAIKVKGPIRVHIIKSKQSKIILREKLVFETWLNEKGLTVLTLAEGASIIVDGEFVLGQGIKVFVARKALLKIKGKVNESGSGITAHSVVMVNKYLEIGEDCLIAWNTFITDCDWHSIEGKCHTKETVIGNHVWIGVGAKVLKGAYIGENSIITSNSIVLQGQYPESSIISGNPAKAVKLSISKWHRDMKNSINVE